MSLFTTELLSTAATSIAGTASVAIAIYWILNYSPISRWLHNSDAVVPSFLSITSFLFGLAISTLAGYSFDRHQSALVNLINESSALDTIISTSTALPLNDQIQLNSGVRAYVLGVIEKEWPAMQKENESEREITAPEFLSLNTTINNVAYKSNQNSEIKSQLLSSLGIIRHDRQVRQSLAYDNNHLKKWPVIPVCSALLLLSVGIVHLGSIKAMKVSLSIASVCVITAILFLFISISPYRGWNPIEPYPLQKTLKILNSQEFSKGK